MKSERDMMEAYARLKALHENLPDRKARLIEPRFVEDFHAILALLQKYSSFDLSGFKVPTSAISVTNPETWYDLHFVAAKIQGLLGFFEIQWSQPTPRIGFRPH
jgi:hypothetical protein